jgi:uncharacterized membrane protein
LPGVAIAISLVPPLANVGILIALHRWQLATGSLLLFVTNYLAIVLTGTFMFALMGFPRAARAGQSLRARRTALAVVVILALLIVVPLAGTSYQISRDTIAERRVTAAAQVWLSGSGYRVVSATATEGKPVYLIVGGTGELPPLATLQQALKGRLFGKAVTVEAIPERSETVQTQ